jgi:hypothetical protein
MNLFFVYILTFIVFFGGSMEGYGLLPPLVNWLTEPLIYLFFVFSIASSKSRIRLPYWYFFGMLFLVGICSAIANSNLGIGTVFGLRLVFRYYLFFLAMVNMGYSELELRKLEKFMFFCFLIQIPVIFVKMLIYGQGESATGTYSLTDGSVVAFFPLIAAGYLMGFYLYVKPSKKYLFLILAFIGTGVMGHKRALPFLIPPSFVFIAFMALRDKLVIKKKIPDMGLKLAVISIILITVTFMGSVKTMESLNPEGEKGGSIDVDFIINKILTYEQTTSKANPEYTGGRTATTVRVFTTLPKKGIVKMMFGYGPGTYISSRFSEDRKRTGNNLRGNELFRDMKFYYGVTPLNFTAMEYGYSGVVLYLLFIIFMFRSVVKTWKKSIDSYERAMGFGAVVFAFVYVIIWSWYSNAILLGDTMPFVFYFMLATSFCRLIRPAKIVS